VRSGIALPERSGWEWLVTAALAEDIGPGDATARALLPEGQPGRARIEARQELVVCGLAVAREVFARRGVELDARAGDAAHAAPGEVLAYVEGPAVEILAAERTALNFLQRLSGVATHTRRHVEATRGTRARVVDTRKTTPGWRALEKYAVRCGGGDNHRMGLYDGILIKDNHVAALGSVSEAVKRAREHAPFGLRIQVEVESVAAARDAIAAGAHALLVDNQPPAVIRQVVELAEGRVDVEASGGVTLANLAEIAACGVDRISIGALTHSAAAVDLALEWEGISSS